MINGCWYVELGSVESLLSQSLLQQRKDILEEVVGCLPKIMENQWVCKCGKRYYYDEWNAYRNESLSNLKAKFGKELIANK